MPLHAPRRLDGVGMSACTPIIEADAVSVTLRVEIPVHRPAISDDRSAEFDPCICNSQCQRFCPERERETFYRTDAQHRQTPTAP